MNNSLIELFACYMLEFLVAKKVISSPTSQEMCDEMVAMLCNDFKQYLENHGAKLDNPSVIEQPPKVIVMSRGSQLSN